MRIRGSVVLLTGASRGLGSEMAAALAREGARLALVARSRAGLEGVATEARRAGSEAVAVPADVGSLDSLRRAVAATEEALGPVDVLVNNAGVETIRDFEDMDLEDMEAIVRVNLLGTLWLTRLVVPGMIARGRGQIVNIASVAGLAPVPHNAPYSATKHALVGLSRSLRIELAEHGVGVSVVCPGFVEGGMFLAWGRRAPRVAGSVSPARVSAAVVSAIRRNAGEVVVAGGGNRLADVAVALSPSLYEMGIRITGVERYLRDQARMNAERRAAER